MKSFFRVSIDCRSVWDGEIKMISFTQSRSLLIPLAISLIVSRKRLLWLISSGILDRILLREQHFLFNSWKASSGRRIRESSDSGFKACNLSKDSVTFRVCVPSIFFAIITTRSKRRPGLVCSAFPFKLNSYSKIKWLFDNENRWQHLP